MDENSKQIIIKAGIDDSEFINKVRAMKESLDRLQQDFTRGQRAQQAYDPSSTMGRAAKTAYQPQEQEQLQHLRNIYFESMRSADVNRREYTKKIEEEKKLNDLIKNSANLSKEQIDNLEKQLKVVREIKEEKKKTLETEIETNRRTKEELDKRTRTTTVDEAQPGFMAQLMTKMGGWKGVAGTATGIGGAIVESAEIAQHRVTRNRQMLFDLAEQQKTVNMNLNNQLKGEGSRNFMENEERKFSLEMAMKERAGQQGVDITKLIGNIMMKATGGAVAGTVLGGPVGTVVGGILGAGMELTKPRSFNQLFDRSAYQQTLNTEALKNYEQNLANAKAMNPEKFFAQDMWIKNYQRYQQVERAIGTTNLFGSKRRDYSEIPEIGPRPERFKTKGVGDTEEGSYNETPKEYERRLADWERQKQINVGKKSEIDRYNKEKLPGWYESNMTVNGRPRFSQERIEQAAGELLGEGATAGLVKGQGAQQVAILQQMGITNAGRVAGRAASLGEGMGSFDTTKKLIADAMTLGIDNSALSDQNGKFSEDMRRFIEITSQIYQQSGGGMGAVREFEKGFTGAGGAQLQGAVTSYQQLNQAVGEAGGYTGALKWSYFASKEGKQKFKGANLDLLSSISMMDLNDLNINDPRVKELARVSGVTPEESMVNIKDMLTSSIDYSGRVTGKKKDIGESYRKFLGGRGSSQKLWQEYAKTSEFGQLSEQLNEIWETQGNKIQGGMMGRLSNAMRMAAPDTLGDAGAMGDWDKMADRSSDADTQEASVSKDTLVNLDILNRQLGPLAEAAKSNTEETIKQTAAITLFNTSVGALIEIVQKGGHVNPDTLRIIQDQQRKMNLTQPNVGNVRPNAGSK